MVQRIEMTRFIKYDFDVKEEVEEFSYVTSFTANKYTQHNPLWLFDLSTWGQIHNMAGRGLITGWPSTQWGDCWHLGLTRKQPSGWYWDNNHVAVPTAGEVWEV